MSVTLHVNGQMLLDAMYQATWCRSCYYKYLKYCKLGYCVSVVDQTGADIAKQQQLYLNPIFTFNKFLTKNKSSTVHNPLIHSMKHKINRAS